MTKERFISFIDPKTQKWVYTHTTLLEPEQTKQVGEVFDKGSTFTKYTLGVSLWLSMEAVNRFKFLYNLKLGYRGGIVLGASACSGLFSYVLYNKLVAYPEMLRILHGAPVFENLSEVPELDKAYFILDDDNNYEPSLWHHAM